MARSRSHVRRIVDFGAVIAVVATTGLIGTATVSAAPPPATRYVSVTGSDGVEPVNDCLQKATPCRTIQHAVDEAAAGDTVSVAAGTYAESVTIVDKPLTVTGSTTGKTIVTGAAQDPQTDPFGFEIVAGETVPTDALQHLTVSVPNGSTPNAQAAGLAVEGATVSVSDSNLTDNGLYGLVNFAGVVTVTASSIDHNQGAGVFQYAGTLTLVGSSVSDNVQGNVSNSGIPFGIGLFLLGGSATVTDSTLARNGFGAIIEPINAPSQTADALDIQDSTVSGSTIAGLASVLGHVTVGNSTFAGNADAGLLAEYSTMDVANSTITGTKLVAGSTGLGPDQAGISVLDPPISPTSRLNLMTLPKSLRVPAFSKSPARTGVPTPSAVTPATPPPKSVVHVSGTISAGNQTPDCSGTVIDDGYNLSGDSANSCSFATAKHSLVKTAAELGPLADNGGETLTVLPAGTSPALDRIPVGRAGCVAGATDQRGVPRPQGDTCDIGAVEQKLTPIVIHPAGLPHGTVGKAYHQTLTATGGRGSGYVWSLKPGTTLPQGLTLSATGLLSGTPVASGTFAVTVSVDDPVLKTYSLIVDPAAVVTTPTTTSSVAPTTVSSTASITPTLSTVTPTTTTGPALAATGTPAGTLGIVGLGSVLAGFLLLGGLTLLRRRNAPHHR